MDFKESVLTCFKYLCKSGYKISYKDNNIIQLKKEY